MTTKNYIVFTDLDGTLLDHDSYSYAAALPALNALKDSGTPLILASSKTAAEIAPLRAELGFDHCPAIVENGAGLLAAHAGAGDGAAVYARLRSVLNALPGDLRQDFEGFGDWSVEELAERTGLPPEAAALARRRAFSEPGIWTGSEAAEAAFVAALAERGVKARRGGRFLTLSFGGTKADRMDEIAAPHAPVTMLALGDAPNDIEMLQRADIGIVIANPHGPALPRLEGEGEGQILRSSRPGPEGWNEMVTRVVLSSDSQ